MIGQEFVPAEIPVVDDVLLKRTFQGGGGQRGKGHSALGHEYYRRLINFSF